MSTVLSGVTVRFRDLAQELRRLLCVDRNRTLPPFAQLSWAQEGEDLVLCVLFERAPPVSRFFVDVGAHHPQRFSNTWLFYQRGWRGINIDPFPGGMKEFDRLRPRDINIEVAISERPGRARLHVLDDSALSTLSDEMARDRQAAGVYRVEHEVQVATATLASILGEHIPVGHPIDFMTIDVEGAELAVLRSMDWSRWRPTLLLVEELEEADGVTASSCEFLREIGYAPVARTPRTVFYRADPQTDSVGPSGTRQ